MRVQNAQSLTYKMRALNLQDPREGSPAADLLLQGGGGLAQFSLRQDSTYTLVQYDLWPYVVNGWEVSFDQSVSLAEGLALQPKCLCDSCH